MHPLKIHRYMPHRLHRVGMEQHLPLPAQRTDFGNGLDGADFIVGEHHRNQGGVRPNGGRHVLHPDDAVFIHRQQGDFKAPFLQGVQRVEDGVMLEHGGDDVFLALLFQALRHHFQRPVVRLAASRSDEHLVGPAVQAFRHGDPGGIHPLAGRLPEAVQGGGVAIFLGEVGNHFIQHLRQQAGGGGVVRVNKTCG